MQHSMGQKVTQNMCTEYVHKQFHARTRNPEAFPRDGHNPKDTGKSIIRGDWEKAGRKSRAE